jgi:hypothetical protein
MGSLVENNNHHLVLKYFSLIERKDMKRLLNLFTEDGIIYEPFSRERSSYSNNGIGKASLKGRSEIESFLNVVMMASDGLQFEIEFIDGPIRDYEQIDNTINSTTSSIISVLATFYRHEGEAQLKERLSFHIVSKTNDESNYVTTTNNNHNNEGKIKTLWIQFCAPESSGRQSHDHYNPM